MKQSKWYTVKALADDGDGPVDVYIYDEIPAFGSAAVNFANDLAAIDANAITLHINSPGGSVFDGIAIGNTIAGHPAHVTGVVDGVAASIASVIAVKCDTLVMNENSQLMLHNAWDLVMGNADDFEKAAATLRGFSTNIASIYAAKAGGEIADWQAVMDAETWLTAQEAVDMGLADEMIVDTIKAPALSFARATFDLSKFRYSGREAAPAPIILARNQAPQPVEVEETQEKETPVGTLNESLVELLGLDAAADDDAITAKVVELQARPEKAEEPAPPAEPTGEQLTAAAAKLDMVMVPKSQYAETVAAVTELQNVRAAQVASDNERFLDDAVKAGKIGPANKVALLPLMKVDPAGTRAIVEAIPAGVIPVAEQGHGTGSEEDHYDAGLATAFAKITGQAIGKDN